METEKFSGETESAWGVPIPKLVYNAEVEKFSNINEVRAANEYPKDTEVVDFVNAKRKANARQKAMVQAWIDAGYQKPTLANSPAKRFYDMVEILESAGKSNAEARAVAGATLNLNPEDFS